MNNQESTDFDKPQSEELTIYGYQYLDPISSVIAPLITINRADILAAQAKSVTELLKRLPGISLVQSGGIGQQSSLFVRGTESRHVLVLIDGIRLNQANLSGSSDLSQIPVAMIQKIEFIRGAQSALYGSDAIGGVINLITYPEDKEDTQGEVRVMLGSFDSQSYELSQNLNMKDTLVYGALSFNRSTGTDVVANMPEAGGVRQKDADGYENAFAWLSLSHQFSSHLNGQIRLYGFKNSNKYDGFFDVTYPQYLIDERELNSQSLDSRFYWVEGAYSAQWIASHNITQDYNYNTELGRHHPSTNEDNIVQNQLQMINTWRYAGGSLNFGMQWQQQLIEQRTSYVDGGVNHLHMTQYASFLTSQYQYKDWIGEYAIRYDNHAPFNGHLTYHVGLSRSLLDDLRVSLMAGHAYKAPNALQLYSQFGGNKDLQPEESNQVELGLEGYQLGLDYRLSIYQNLIQNRIEYQLSKYNNFGSAKIIGSELELSVEKGFYTHKATFAYIDTKDRETKQRLLRRAAYQFDYEILYHKNPYEARLNYHLEGPRDDIWYDPLVDENKKEKLPLNQQIDVSVGYHYTNNITIRGRIEDIFNQQRETVYGYQPTRRAFYVTGEYRF